MCLFFGVKTRTPNFKNLFKTFVQRHLSYTMVRNNLVWVNVGKCVFFKRLDYSEYLVILWINRHVIKCFSTKKLKEQCIVMTRVGLAYRNGGKSPGGPLLFSLYRASCINRGY